MEPKKVKWSQVRHHWEIYLFVLPTLIGIGLFIYYPAASGIFHSFFRWNGADISEPLGMWNYKDLLFSTAFWTSFRNAFIIGIWNVVKMIPPLFVAVCIHRCVSERMQYIYRILFVVPMVIPPLVIALIWRSFFFEATNGYLNQFIYGLNLEGFMNKIAPIFGWGDAFMPGKGKAAWLGDPNLILTAVIVWGFPWVSSLAVLTHLAKLQGIGKAIYEAADIDGVNWWTKFTKVELPLITGSIYIMLVFTIIGTIIDAGMILALAGFEGGPGGKVDVPALFMIRKAFVDQKMGYACAVGIILMLVVMTLQKGASLVNEWSEYHVDKRKALKKNLLLIGLIFNAAAPAMRIWKDAAEPLYLAIARDVHGYAQTWLGGWNHGYDLTFPSILHRASLLLFLVVLPYGKIYAALRKSGTRIKLFALALFLAFVIPTVLMLGGLGDRSVLPWIWESWVVGYDTPLFAFLRRAGVLLLGAVGVGFVPFETIFTGLRNWSNRIRFGVSSDSEESIGDIRNQRVIDRESKGWFQKGRAASQALLRFNRHAYIWFVLAFAFLPLYLMIIVSFKTNTQFYSAPATLTHPIHPENWAEAWRMVTPTLANSVFLSVNSTLLMLCAALMGAYFFARQRMPLSGFFWNAILILMMLPMIANLVPLFRLLRDLNLLNTLTALILVGAAQGQIFAIFMLRNFVSDIPQDLYEAAEIDGASHFRQMWLIVLPLSGPILGTVGVMHFMNAWNEFIMALIVMRDHARLPVMVQLIRMAGEYIKLWGPLMAGYAMASIPIIILFTFSMKLFVKGMTEGAVKG